MVKSQEQQLLDQETDITALKTDIQQLKNKLASCGKIIRARDEMIAELRQQLRQHESAKADSQRMMDQFAQVLAIVSKRFYGRPEHFYTGEQMKYSDEDFIGNDFPEARALFEFLNELLGKIWSLVWPDGHRVPRPDWVLYKCFAMIVASILDYVLDSDFQWFNSCNMMLTLKNACHCHETLNMLCTLIPGAYGSDHHIHDLSVALVEMNKDRMEISALAPLPGDLIGIYDQASDEYKPKTSRQVDQPPQSQIVTLSLLGRQFSSSNTTESLQMRYDCSPKSFPPNSGCSSDIFQLTAKERGIHKDYTLDVIRKAIQSLKNHG